MNVKREKIFLISLGCAKNLVDSEHMLGSLKSAGYALARDPEEADVALINTCGFIQSAVEEAVDTILETARLKEKGSLKRLVVAGCLVQRYGYKLEKEIPEVDAWLGTGEIGRVVEILGNGFPAALSRFHLSRPTSLADHAAPRARTTPFYTAYLKIAEGCSHGCSYCIIPHLRGPFRSRTPDSLLREAEEMVAEGVREINLVAQDTTSYGRDLEPKGSLEDLLERLVGIRGLEWIRLMYCHPDRISDRLLALMDSEERICPYLDLPLQHINLGILEAMRRRPEGQTHLELVRRIRSGNRRIHLRTTLMVGFPGESEAIFQELLAFVEEARFEHLGAFVFSPERGSPAYRLKPRVKQTVAKERMSRIMTCQAGISKTLNQEMINRTVPVLIEGESRETSLLLAGRTASMAPDVDGCVLINKGTGVAGEIMPVRITKAYAYDLVGEIV
ncbi:MAG: 30S ribosomal protein S12 methylthiotransferase RimO [Desulfatiglandaceae bacterium]|jgi:ribosomal protein S12 methylthiotransferase